MTWDYSDPDDLVAPEDMPEEWVWARLRRFRDRLLAQTDHKMVSDAPWDTTPWASYRQALRDLPANTTDPRAAVWPTMPAA